MDEGTVRRKRTHARGNGRNDARNDLSLFEQRQGVLRSLVFVDCAEAIVHVHGVEQHRGENVDRFHVVVHVLCSVRSVHPASKRHPKVVWYRLVSFGGRVLLATWGQCQAYRDRD